MAFHERFGTYDVVAGDGASTTWSRARAETYAAPGALPDVRPGDLHDDLLRRDFTVNALALNAAGELQTRPGPWRTWRPAACGCCTRPRSATIRRGCGASCATRCAWASRRSR